MRTVRFYFYPYGVLLLYEALLRMGIERSLHLSCLFYCYGNRGVFKLDSQIIKLKLTAITTTPIKSLKWSNMNFCYTNN